MTADTTARPAWCTGYTRRDEKMPSAAYEVTRQSLYSQGYHEGVMDRLNDQPSNPRSSYESWGFIYGYADGYEGSRFDWQEHYAEGGR